MSIFGTPTYDNSYNAKIEALLSQQSENIGKYFNEAGSALETQYGSLYGQTMTDAVNKLASKGIYNSPVSQVSLNRTTKSLADTYANAKSQLAAQRLSAEGNLTSQQISYFENLANQQFQQQLAESQSEASLFGSIAGLGGGLLGGIL